MAWLNLSMGIMSTLEKIESPLNIFIVSALATSIVGWELLRKVCRDGNIFSIACIFGFDNTYLTK